MRIAFALAALFALAAPAHAAERTERVVLVFGDDVCPKSSSEEEIVVCARAPEGERYRIPERFRGEEISPRQANESWAVKAEALEFAGKTGINSCSTIGPGGWTGCYAEMLRIAQAERRAARRERERIDGPE